MQPLGMNHGRQHAVHSSTVSTPNSGVIGQKTDGYNAQHSLSLSHRKKIKREQENGVRTCSFCSFFICCLISIALESSLALSSWNVRRFSALLAWYACVAYIRETNKNIYRHFWQDYENFEQWNCFFHLCIDKFHMLWLAKRRTELQNGRFGCMSWVAVQSDIPFYVLPRVTKTSETRLYTTYLIHVHELLSVTDRLCHFPTL